MKVAKLTEEQLRQVFATDALERAEGSIGQFSNCIVKNGDLHGKIKGNHGVYSVSLHTSQDELTGACECKSSETGLCKHVAALGLSYIYTPWVFTSADKIDRNKLKSLEEIQFYIAITPLRTLLDELKEKKGVGLARFAELTKTPMQHLMQVIKCNEAGVPNSFTEMVKLSSMYLIDKEH